MTNLNYYSPSTTDQSASRNAGHAAAQSAEDADLDAGLYRGARDYPFDDFAYLDFPEVEELALNAADYDAAELLDMN